jgi:hypothetical protein
MMTVTVTAYGNCTIDDVDGLEKQVPNTAKSVNLANGDVKTFTVTNRAWDSRIRDQLVRLSQMRIPLNDGLTVNGRTRPLITYTVNPLPDQRPQVNQIEAATSTLLDLSDAPNIVLKGTNLIPGVAATATVGTGTGSLTITALNKGPSGNKIKVVILPGTASPSVTNSLGEDGDLTVTVVPAVASQANAIATQLNGNAFTALFLSATGGGTGKVVPQTIQLANGDDTGVASRIFPSVLATSWLRVVANKPGNSGNNIAIRINAASGGGSVAVSGTTITVTPAAGTITVSAVAAQINGNATAAALVTATAQGTSNLSPAVMGPRYLWGGAGEDVTATVGGAVSTISVHTDTQITLVTSNAALVAANVAAGEAAVIVVKSGYRIICQLPVAVVA